MIHTKFYDFINERYEINNLSDHIVMLSKSGGESYTFLLYDTIKKEPIGYIGFGYYNTIDSYTVEGAYANRGYGPFLYESAMTMAYPYGVSMSRSGNTSWDALNVWKKFLDRTDVKHERMYSDEITHKKEDWGTKFDGNGFMDDEPEEKQAIFDLEDTRFYYNYGKEKLENLLKIGKRYQNDNNISDDDIDYMTWELE